jgi:hypothetical protein
VTITLDKQTISDFLPPSAGAVAPNRITTDALDIHLNNARLFGKTISGDIMLGKSSAALWPPPFDPGGRVERGPATTTESAAQSSA